MLYNTTTKLQQSLIPLGEVGYMDETKPFCMVKNQSYRKIIFPHVIVGTSCCVGQENADKRIKSM